MTPSVSPTVKLAAVLALSLLAGCASQARGPVVLTLEGDAVALQAAQDAVSEWQAVCGAEVSLGPSGVPLRPATVGDHGGETWTQGGRAVWVAYRPDSSPEALRALMTHEIGHVLGLGHTPEGVADIMAAEATDVRHVRIEDCADL